MDTVLHVVTHRRWVADELAAAATVRVVPSLGLDVPAGLGTRDPWWAPMPWAARAAATGVDLRVSDPGPHFLTRLPEAVLGRAVTVCRLDELTEVGPAAGFYKPANVKIDRLPATTGTAIDFTVAARAAGIPGGTLVLAADRVLPFAEEHRVWVRHGEPVASACYLLDATGPGTGTVAADVDVPAAGPRGLGPQARAFAADALDGVDVPTGFVLDVARTWDPATGRLGDWVVVEANPAWCAGHYTADPTGVAATIVAAHHPAPGPVPHPWTPDPYLAATARPLPRP